MEADMQKYPAHETRGPLLLGSAYGLHAITIIVFLIRLYSRLTPRFALTAADYTITIAVIVRTASVILTTMAVHRGFGQHVVHIPPGDNLYQLRVYIFATFFTSNASSAFARISIACLLLQVTQRRSWRIAIVATIAVQAFMMVFYVIIQLVQCSSLVGSTLGSGTEDRPGDCLGPNHIRVFAYVKICTAMLGDLVCAVIPICLIHALSRSLVEKVLTSVLLASSLIASGIGIAKIYFQVTYDFGNPDALYMLANVFFWSRLEDALIIIAACAPLLRQPVEAALKRLGFRGFSVPEPKLDTISTGLASENSSSRAGAGAFEEEGKRKVVIGQSLIPGESDDGTARRYGV